MQMYVYWCLCPGWLCTVHPLSHQVLAHQFYRASLAACAAAVFLRAEHLSQTEHGILRCFTYFLFCLLPFSAKTNVPELRVLHRMSFNLFYAYCIFVFNPKPKSLQLDFKTLHHLLYLLLQRPSNLVKPTRAV